MVTKYDVFEIVYKNDLIRPRDIVEKLGKTGEHYKNVYRILIELTKEGLVHKKDEYFWARKDGRPKALYEIIAYCLDNSINYNLMLDKKLMDFVWNGLSRGKLNQEKTPINPRTFKKYLDILDKYGLVLIIAKKPLVAKIFSNALINNILTYFNFKQFNIKKTEINYVEEIKKELGIYRKLRKKNERGFQKIVGEFEVSFVQHSLSLEGNPITLPDTIKILKDNILPANLRIDDVEEIKNYQNAILQMLSDSLKGKPLTLANALNYHRLTMAHRPEIAGKIRTVEVFIKGNPDFKITRAKHIRICLERLFQKYNDFIKNKKKGIKEILAFSSYFHNAFQHTHPFVDGNSRITRLITFHLLNSMNVPILDIPFGLLEDYLHQTKASKRRDDYALAQSLSKVVLFNLKKINEKLAQ